ncbi:MAG: alanyl-tRNA editing protein [Candidatus Altiarchaeota archaeon]|nr:alanyl-tRNA editing protein [Candidatus Altiarchaeota archaeon]
MTELLHMKDCYIKRFEAEIVEVLESGVVLSETAFYPLAGGVQEDKGMLVVNGKKYNVTATKWMDEKVVHILDSVEGLTSGTKVNGELEWDRRYKIMRLHTAAHLLEAVIYKKTGALIGGGKVSVDGSYMGFTLDEMDRELIIDTVKVANKLVDAGAKVKVSFMKGEEALKHPGMVKLAGKLPPKVAELRIVEIEGIDRQACGGPHVENINEIEEIRVVKLKNKGAKNRRLYFEVI